MTLLIVDLWQYCAICIRSGVTRCTIFMVLYLCRMCQCWLHVMIWSHLRMLMRLLAAEPRSTAGPLLPSQCPCGTILLILYSMVWDWRVSRARPMLFYRPKQLYPFLSSTIFPFLFLVSLGWYCAAGVSGPIGIDHSLPALHFRPLLITIMENKYFVIGPRYCFPCRSLFAQFSFYGLVLWGWCRR